jgi:uncharacterized RDD family membrane protein YckC
MSGSTKKNNSGLYYEKCAHASVFVRFAVSILDMVIVLMLGGGAALVLSTAFGVRAGVLLAMLIFWAYFIELKRSHGGTVGYRLFGMRLVDLHGDSPGRFNMLVRAAFWLVALFSLPIDMVWISSDENRQALRDKFTGTYVIRKSAEPKGHGPIVRARYMMFGTNWVFQEVMRPKGGA